jgi:hypothetical protein
LIRLVRASSRRAACVRRLLNSLAVLPLFVGCYTWRAIDDPVFEGGELYAVAANGERLVAVGLSYTEYGTTPSYAAAVWTSIDGRGWTRIRPGDSILGRLGNQAMTHVVWTGSRFVAGGMDWSAGDADVAFWTSSEGLKWQRAPHNEKVLGGRGNQVLQELGTGRAGVIGVGQSARAGAAGYTDPAAWFSRDGVSWSTIVLGRSREEAQGQLPLDIVMERPGVPLVAEVVGFDAGNPGNCGLWGVTSGDGSSLRITPALTALNLCGPTTAWQRYPVRVAQYDGYTYAVIRSRATDASGEPTVHTVLTSPPEGGWATLIAFEDPMFANALGRGLYDSGFAVVGNAGDFDGVVAWIWRVGDEERTMLPRVLRSNERITSYANDVIEFRGLPVVVGYDLTGSVIAPRRAHGVVWYRDCRILRWSLCQADELVKTFGVVVFGLTMMTWLALISLLGGVVGFGAWNSWRGQVNR